MVTAPLAVVLFSGENSTPADGEMQQYQVTPLGVPGGPQQARLERKGSQRGHGTVSSNTEFWKTSTTAGSEEQ